MSYTHDILDEVANAEEYATAEQELEAITKRREEK